MLLLGTISYSSERIFRVTESLFISKFVGSILRCLATKASHRLMGIADHVL